jgi:hypothetical protein
MRIGQDLKYATINVNLTLGFREQSPSLVRESVGLPPDKEKPAQIQLSSLGVPQSRMVFHTSSLPSSVKMATGLLGIPVTG